jgi:hypothetical protein
MQDVNAAKARHLLIQKNEVEWRPSEFSEGRFAIGNLHDGVASLAELVGGQHANFVLVVGQENAHCGSRMGGGHELIRLFRLQELAAIQWLDGPRIFRIDLGEGGKFGR